MKDIFITDLYRITKSKNIKIAFLIEFIIVVILSLLVSGLNSTLKNSDVNSDVHFYSNSMFSILIGNGSLVLTICLIFNALIFNQDYSYGTIRLKILSGKSRLKIYFGGYFAYMLVTTIVSMISLLVYFLISGLINGVSNDGLTIKAINYYLVSMAIMLLCILLQTTFMYSLGHILKNGAKTIVLIVVSLYLSFIITTFVSSIEGLTRNDNLYILKIICRLIPHYQTIAMYSSSSIFSLGESNFNIVQTIDKELLLFFFITSPIYLIIVLCLGLRSFKKNDIR